MGARDAPWPGALASAKIVASVSSISIGPSRAESGDMLGTARAHRTETSSAGAQLSDIMSSGFLEEFGPPFALKQTALSTDAPTIT
jgi:hypothetical protein